MKKDPIETMLEVHRELERQLGLLQKSLERFKDNGNVDEMRLALDGFFFFVKDDMSKHIEDEEKALFPVMKTAGLLNQELEAIIDEHEAVAASVETLGLLKDMDSLTYQEIQDEVEDILDTFRGHALKEETLLFKQARENLTEDQMKFVAKKMGGSKHG